MTGDISRFLPPPEDGQQNNRRADRRRQRSTPEVGVTLSLSDNMMSAFVQEKNLEALPPIEEECELPEIVSAINKIQTKEEQLSTVVFHKDFGVQHKLGTKENKTEG